MKKSELLKLGLSEEQADSIIDLVTEERKEFVPRTRLNEVIAERDEARESVKERDAQLEDLKKSTKTIEELNEKISTLQNDNKSKDEAHARELKQLKVNSAIDTLMLEYKAKNHKAVSALLDLNLDEVEILEDGTIKGLADKFKALSESEETSFMFESKEPKLTGATPTPSVSTPTNTKVDLDSMNYDELSAYFENKQ